MINTHQAYATAVGLVAPRLPAVATTLVNAVLGDVTVAPYASAASLDMGVLAVKPIGDPEELNADQVREAIEVFQDYGQTGHK